MTEPVSRALALLEMAGALAMVQNSGYVSETSLAGARQLLRAAADAVAGHAGATPAGGAPGERTEPL